MLYSSLGGPRYIHMKQLSRAICVQPSAAIALFLGISVFSPLLHATITNVQLGTSPASPQLLGTSITLTANATDSDPGPLTYKWEVLNPGFGAFSTLRDFDETTTLTWAPNFAEGSYQLRLTARDYLAGTSAQHVIQFIAKPLVTGSQPVAVATANPLVALFSSPTCAIGSTMNVVFQLQGSPLQTSTDARPCHAGSQNFYIGGMLAQSTYTMFSQVTTSTGTVTNGPSISFATGTIPTSMKFPTRSIPVAPITGADTTSDIVLSGYTTPPGFPIATDLSGNVLWYYTTALQMTRPVPGGTILSIPNGEGTGTGVWGPGITRQQLLREFDLVGNIVHETNCDRIYEQLEALGLTDPLGRFNHDAIRLSNGQTMVIGDVQRIFPAGTQGSTVPIDIIGDVIVVLDDNFQVVSYWNAFNYDCAGTGCISINRKGDNTCTVNPKTGQTPGGCPPALLSSPANDWLHINDIEYLPTDGDILASVRDQNWITKIDYNNGTGTGDFLWQLGLGGNFTLVGSLGEPYPWFSGQHNPGFIDNGETTLLVFDNGPNRVQKYGGDSRGQVWTIDQTAMTATLTLNNDLGVYSPALGSAQVMLNGNYNFFAGDITDGTSTEILTTEYSPTGTIDYQYEAIGPSQAYRGWRLPSLYQSTLDGSAGPE
jgi:arylsulfate sulfotransferase